MTTALSSDHAQKARMYAAQARRYIDALNGRSELKVGNSSVVALLDNLASLLEFMVRDKSRGRRTTADERLLAKNPGKHFIRQGSILVRKPFDTAEAAKAWATKNYSTTTGWSLVSPNH